MKFIFFFFLVLYFPQDPHFVFTNCIIRLCMFSGNIYVVHVSQNHQKHAPSPKFEKVGLIFLIQNEQISLTLYN